MSVSVTTTSGEYRIAFPPSNTHAATILAECREIFGRKLVRWDGKYRIWNVSDPRPFAWLMAKMPELLDPENFGGVGNECSAPPPIDFLTDSALASRAAEHHLFDLHIAPYRHQSLALTRLAEWDYTGLVMGGTGSGKTLLAIVSAMQQAGYCIVVGLDATRIKYRRDAWQYSRCVVNLIPKTNKGSERTDALARIPDSQLTYLSFEQARMYASELATITEKNPCALLIVDECDHIANDSQQTAAILGIRGRDGKRVGGIAHERFMAMSATPVVNNPADLWNVLSAIDPVLWSDRDAFVNRYCETVRTQRGTVPLRAKVARLPELYERMGARTLRIDTARVFPDLPPYELVDVEVELTAEARREYDLAVRDLGTWLREQGKSAREVARSLHAKALTQTQYLRMAAAKAKVPAARELIDRSLAAGEQIVVFCTYLDPLRELEKTLIAGGIKVAIITGDNTRERQGHMDAFQAGELRVALCTPKAGGAGIELFAARLALLIDEPWTAKDVIQAIGRIWRPGQTRHQLIYTLLATETDFIVHDRVVDKWRIQDVLMQGGAVTEAEGDDTTTLVAVLEQIEALGVAA